MESPVHGLLELAGMTGRAARRTLEMGATRIELLFLELQEERDRLLLSIQMALCAAVLGLLAGNALTLGVMVLLWEHHPAAALGAATLIYAGAAAFCCTRYARLQRDYQMFSATLDQLKKDRDCLIGTNP